jgi:hypothetical protein
LRVPFYVNSPLNKTDLDRSTINPNFTGTDYAQISLFVLNALVAPTNGSTSLSISVHVVFDDVEFYAPHTDVSYALVPLVAQGLIEDLKSAGTSAINGVFSSARRLSGDILDALRSGIRTYTGLHSPNQPTIQAKDYVQSRNVANTTDSMVYFDKMDNFSNFDRVCKDFIFETTQDEMDIKYLGRKPQFLGTFSVSTTDTTGTLLWSRPITPAQAFYASTYVNSDSETINTFRFDSIQQILWYISKYWKGSINIHIQSVMSNFHFCKLAIARDYSVRNGSLTSYPTFSSVPNLMTEFLEFSAGGQIQTVVMPYVSPLNQLPCSIDPVTNAVQHGMYYIYLNQPLVTNGSVSLSAKFNVFISLGDDFEFYGYSTNPARIVSSNVLSEVPTSAPPDEEGFEAQASSAVPISDQSDLSGSSYSKTNYKGVDFRPITNMRDHIRRFYKVFRAGYTAADVLALGGLVTIDVADLIGQKPPFVSADKNSVASTLDILAKMYLGAIGGARFKVVVTGTPVASAWYVPPSFVCDTTLADVTWTQSSPISTTTVTNAARTNKFMYQNLTNSDTNIDGAFSVQCPIVERANFVKPGSNGIYASTGEINYLPESTSLIEFEIPNMSPYKFYGDVAKACTISPTARFLRYSPTSNLGHIVLYIPPTTTLGPSVTAVGVNVAIFASYDDVARFGYQIFVPNINIPAYIAPKPSPLVGNTFYALGTQNNPPTMTTPGPEMVRPNSAGQTRFNYYTKFT